VKELIPNTSLVGRLPVIVKVLDPPSLDETEASVVDVFRKRLRLLVRCSIPRDAYVQVKLENWLLFGEVAFCVATDGVYDVGVLIDDSLCLLPSQNRAATLIEMVGENRLKSSAMTA
jgi:hypothetical protein